MVAVRCQTIETPCNKKLETVAVSPFWTEQDRRWKIFQENQSLALAVWPVLHCTIIMHFCKIVHYYVHACILGIISYIFEWLKESIFSGARNRSRMERIREETLLCWISQLNSLKQSTLYCSAYCSIFLANRHLDEDARNGLDLKPFCHLLILLFCIFFLLQPERRLVAVRNPPMPQGCS